MSENRDIVTVRDVARSLDELRFQLGLDESINPLLEAICADRWDIVAEAAQLIEREKLPRLDHKRLEDYAKTIAASLLLDRSLGLGKMEVFEYIERVHPDIFEVLPTSDRGKSNWWKEMGFNSNNWQARGKKDRIFRDEFEAMIEKAIRNKEAGFPDFLGPRDNPTWE